MSRQVPGQDREELRHLTRLCVGALLLDEGRVLLGLRAAHKTFADCWDLPGGHVEEGEEIEAALVRELDEELGVAPIAWRFHSRHRSGNVELHIFIVTCWSGSPELRNDEHVALAWHTFEEARRLPNLAAEGYRDLFPSLVQVRETSAHG